MQSQFFGQIDLSRIALLMQQQAELKHVGHFQDGDHLMLNVTINQLEQPDRFGNTHALLAYCRKDERKPELNYFIGNLRPSNNDQQQAAPINEANDFWNNIGK